MSLSAVAGVLGKAGDLRVVVTQRWRLRHHVHKGERLFVVPGFEVQEPVPWGNIPYVVDRVEKHIYKWICSRNDPDWQTGGLQIWKVNYERSHIDRRSLSA